MQILAPIYRSFKEQRLLDFDLSPAAASTQFSDYDTLFVRVSSSISRQRSVLMQYVTGGRLCGKP